MERRSGGDSRAKVNRALLLKSSSHNDQRFLKSPRVILVHLEAIINPYTFWPWIPSSSPLRYSEVAEAIFAGKFEEKPYPGLTYGCMRWEWFCHLGFEWPRRKHVRRVAYLVQNGYEDTPINIWVGCDGYIQVEDGHHRISAARFDGKQVIKAKATGCEQMIDALDIQARRFDRRKKA